MARIELPREISIYPICTECGKELHSYLSIKGKFMVEPCEKCIKVAVEIRTREDTP